MKAIICFDKGDIHVGTFGADWTACACGNVRVRWEDPRKGTVVVAAKNRETVRLLGMHNSYLIGAIEPSGKSLSWPEYQELHKAATKAPGYLFDEEKIGCWAAVVKIGRSSDVRWATDEEHAEAFSK